ncbi:MAG: hypothetical protein RBU37_28020, partial [Myxococcota bacterium]|nr:hypothetical protein [Myxococcota bacterium]
MLRYLLSAATTTTSRSVQQPLPTAPEPSLGLIGALAAFVLLSANACTSSLDACSSDADCPKGQTCLLASSGWVESSRCVPIDDCEGCDLELSDGEIDSDQPDGHELDEVSETELEEAEVDECSATCTLVDPPPGQLRCLSSNPSSICAVSCDPQQPWRDCNLDPSDGCEIDTSTDAEHCSACQTPCDFPNAEASCELSTCTMGACLPTHFDLDGSDNNGCELHFEQNASIVLDTLRPGLTDPRGLCHNGELLSFCATDNNQAILGVCQAEDCHYLNVPACEQTQCSDSLVFTLGGLYLNSYAVDSLPPEPISSRFPFYIDNDYAGARISARKLGNRTLLASVAPSARIAAHYWVEAGSLDPHCSGTGPFLSCDAGT